MTISNILVAYNGSESSNAALKAAILAHEKYGAHVTGLLAHRSAKARLGDETWIPKELSASLDQLEASAHRQIRDAFLAAADPRVAKDKLHWIEHHGNADATVADYALMFDLTIVGRRDILQGQRRMELHPDRIAVRSGRPVLVVPRTFSDVRIREHAILAWDGRRTATRALHDSMQILETKQKVTVVTVDAGRLGTPLRGIDVETALARHGIAAETIHLPCHPKGVGRTLLDFCSGSDAGLLVIGAFEHSVFREELLGGVTQQILDHSTIPILMSH